MIQVVVIWGPHGCRSWVEFELISRSLILHVRWAGLQQAPRLPIFMVFMDILPWFHFKRRLFLNANVHHMIVTSSLANLLNHLDAVFVPFKRDLRWLIKWDDCSHRSTCLVSTLPSTNATREHMRRVRLRRQGDRVTTGIRSCRCNSSDPMRSALDVWAACLPRGQDPSPCCIPAQSARDGAYRRLLLRWIVCLLPHCGQLLLIVRAFVCICAGCSAHSIFESFSKRIIQPYITHTACDSGHWMLRTTLGCQRPSALAIRKVLQLTSIGPFQLRSYRQWYVILSLLPSITLTITLRRSFVLELVDYLL